MAKYIDVDKLRDDITKLRRRLDIDKVSNDYAFGWITGVGNMEGVISIQPTADVEPVKRGKWIEDGSGVVTCSECGEEHEWQGYIASYCDTCGAKMDAEEG